MRIGSFEEAGEQVLDEAIGGLDARDLPVPIYRVPACGPPARTLTATSVGAALLVVGRSGLGSVASLVVGSVGQRCAHDAPCPVVIVPPPAP